MRLGYSLILALLLHIVTKSVQTLIIAIYQFYKSFIEKNTSWARNHFLTSFWTSSLEWKSWPLRCFWSSGIWDGSPMAPNQDCMVDVEEFLSPRSSRDSRPAELCRALSCKRRTPSPLVNNPGLTWGGEYIYQLNPCLPTQCRNLYNGNKIGNLTFGIVLVVSFRFFNGRFPGFCIFWYLYKISKFNKPQKIH
jgi:hypothetical protein